MSETLEPETETERAAMMAALEAAGVQYTERTVIDVERQRDKSETSERNVYVSLDSPSAREVMKALATHPKKWVTAREIEDSVEVESVSNRLSELHTAHGVVQRRQRETDDRGRNPYEYRLKELYRREMLADAAENGEMTA